MKKNSRVMKRTFQ